MSERYTSDVPAIPDPDYEWIRPEYKRSLLERIEDEQTEISADFRLLLEDMAKAEREKIPKDYDYFAEHFFKRTGAQEFIDEYAVYDDDGRLNIDLTSAKIGIPYNYEITSRADRGEIVGLPGNTSFGQPIEIHLNPEMQLHQVTFGHEIGHYFWRVVQYDPSEGYNRTEEDFCSYFGRRMALPCEQLVGYEKIDEAAILDIMSRFRANLDDALTALMEYGFLPSRVAIDTYNGKYENPDFSEKVTRGIFCLHCDQVGGDYGCLNVNQPTPLFDFTDRAWGGQMQACLGEDLHNPEIMSTLTKHYVANEVRLVLFRPGALYEFDSKSEEKESKN